MKKFLLTSLATSFVTAMATLGVTSTANAAPAGPSSVDTTISQLQQQGYDVVVSRLGSLQRKQCSITEIRPGQTYSRTDSGAPGAGSSLVTTVMSKTVYVDLSC